MLATVPASTFVLGSGPSGFVVRIAKSWSSWGRGLAGRAAVRLEIVVMVGGHEPLSLARTAAPIV